MQIGTESATVASCQWQSANVGDRKSVVYY